MGWLAQHLGHDIKTHKTYYRQQEAVIETAKITRLLMAADSGQLHRYKGKKLDDIQLQGNILMNNVQV